MLERGRRSGHQRHSGASQALTPNLALYSLASWPGGCDTGRVSPRRAGGPASSFNTLRIDRLVETEGFPLACSRPKRGDRHPGKRYGHVMRPAQAAEQLLVGCAGPTQLDRASPSGSSNIPHWGGPPIRFRPPREWSVFAHSRPRLRHSTGCSRISSRGRAPCSCPTATASFPPRSAGAMVTRAPVSAGSAAALLATVIEDLPTMGPNMWSA